MRYRLALLAALALVAGCSAPPTAPAPDDVSARSAARHRMATPVQTPSPDTFHPEMSYAPSNGTPGGSRSTGRLLHAAHRANA